ncbi:hypothetical protein J7E63_13090 [Bacillus sp. ISL-75]|uniref:hypothetical protein n=1 Tax=Bacillus sp. ISL-75 TaxID=2819137 RepID=UPI001BE8AAA5|nr:hypothetical protein [Bacillus sp. ISL-75]MBT2727875.1 hypothetical protein [Bacillus sp. ISL-75]
MKKVLLTKEQAEALENALEHCEEKAGVIENHVRDLWSGKRELLNRLSLETITVALYIGYEIDKSPEEKIFNLYQFYSEWNNPSPKALIKNVLDILNIRIKGVNC